jgi:hypothetical protein
VKDKPAALILGIGQEHDDDEPKGSLGMALRSLAKAMKSEDWERAEEAFKEAVIACDEDEDEEAESDDSDDDDDDELML